MVREGGSLTWINLDSDNACCRHRLDDVARPLTCQVVAMSCCPAFVGLDVVGPSSSIVRRRSSIIGCHVAPEMTVTTCVVTVWTTCQVIAVSPHPSSIGLVTWRCHVVDVVRVSGGGSGRETVVAEGRGCWSWWWSVAVDGGGG